MPKAVTVSLDQIMSERVFSVRRTAKGAEALTKIYKSPASWNADERSAKFVMTAQIVDRYGDIVVTKGADTTEFMNNPVGLWAHDMREFPIGMWSDITIVNGSPKRMEGKITLGPEMMTEDCDCVAKLLEAGMVRACSIGFMPKAWESIKDEKDRTVGYQFNEWELLECSICSVPANPAAIVKAAGGDDRLALQAIELVLDEWARTPEGLIVPRLEFERAYAITKDKTITLHEVRSVPEDPAPAIDVNPLDIEAAVSRAIDKASDGIIAKFKSMFGIKDAAPVTVPVVETPENPVVDKTADEDGETEEEFQARIAAENDANALADEAEEEALRQRAAALAA